MTPKILLSRYSIYSIIVLVVSSIYLPSHYNAPYPKPLGPQFTKQIKSEPFRAIDVNQPEFVLIGDSTLYEGVDQTLLTSLVGSETYKMAVPGSATAVWYLVLKNVVVESTHRPKYVVILFRDTMLTIPYFRTTGRYLQLLDDYATKNEPLLVELAFINQMSPLEKLLEQYLPLYGMRWNIREGVDHRIRYSVASMFGCPQQCADDAVKSIFGRELDVIALSQMEADSVDSFFLPDQMDFDHKIDKSFLPAMIALANENNIGLIFVKTRTLTYPTPASEPLALRNYVKSLDAYLSEHDNVYFLDYSQDVRIKDSFFLDGLHFNQYGREEFTPILAEEFRSIINK